VSPQASYSQAEHVERLIERCINYVEVAWQQFRRPTVQRAIAMAYAARAKKFCGINTRQLAELLQADSRIHCIRHPRGATYYLPSKVWESMPDDTRAVLMRRILNRTIFQDSVDAGRPALATDGERSVQYFVPSPMEAFLKKGT
jgi:hypothetical protein